MPSREPDAAIAAMKAAYPELDEEVERLGIGLLTGVWLDPDGRYGAQSAERWADYAAWMKQSGLIPDDLDEHGRLRCGAVAGSDAGSQSGGRSVIQSSDGMSAICRLRSRIGRKTRLLRFLC